MEKPLLKALSNPAYTLSGTFSSNTVFHAAGSDFPAAYRSFFLCVQRPRAPWLGHSPSFVFSSIVIIPLCRVLIGYAAVCGILGMDVPALIIWQETDPYIILLLINGDKSIFNQFSTEIIYFI